MSIGVPPGQKCLDESLPSALSDHTSALWDALARSKKILKYALVKSDPPHTDMSQTFLLLNILGTTILCLRVGVAVATVAVREW